MGMNKQDILQKCQLVLTMNEFLLSLMLLCAIIPLFPGDLHSSRGIICIVMLVSS